MHYIYQNSKTKQKTSFLKINEFFIFYSTTMSGLEERTVMFCISDIDLDLIVTINSARKIVGIQVFQLRRMYRYILLNEGSYKISFCDDSIPEEIMSLFPYFERSTSQCFKRNKNNYLHRVVVETENLRNNVMIMANFLEM
jgi:hypothetical protein